jgi:hypothetical protein
LVAGVDVNFVFLPMAFSRKLIANIFGDTIFKIMTLVPGPDDSNRRPQHSNRARVFGRPGADVMIFRNFSPKNSAKKIGIFDSKQS